MRTCLFADFDSFAVGNSDSQEFKMHAQNGQMLPKPVITHSKLIWEQQ